MITLKPNTLTPNTFAMMDKLTAPGHAAPSSASPQSDADVVGCQHGHEADPRLHAPAYTEQQLRLAAQMCQAMGDPARLRILLWLAQREVCVSELVQLENAKLSSVSAKLQQLHTARLVTRRRQAKHIFYSLADDHIRNLLMNVLNHACEPDSSH
ncbi:MAG: metalloregulator ArsR/SmtB family transcription factor [Lautropia sp.]|nr:metalloregulator ArsR/SmtB family transcription factor [Lautropia sp.]